MERRWSVLLIWLIGLCLALGASAATLRAQGPVPAGPTHILNVPGVALDAVASQEARPGTATAAAADTPMSTTELLAATLYPVKDTWIDRLATLSRWGSANYLRVGSSECPGYHFPAYAHMLMSFDLSSIPPGSSVVSATLHLYQLEAYGDSAASPRYQLWVAEQDWPEDATWYDQAGLCGGVRYLWLPGGTGWRTWDMIWHVRDWLDGTCTNFGFMVKSAAPLGEPDTCNGRVFASREGANKPWLEVQYLPNHPPQNYNLWPDHGGRPAGRRVNFTATHRDADGWRDLKQVFLHIGGTAARRNNCRLRYDVRQNKMYLLDNAGTTWLGGFAPGAANLIRNRQCTLSCAKSTVTKSGRTVKVMWNLVFRTSFRGTKDSYMHSVDMAGAKTAWEKMGTYRVK